MPPGLSFFLAFFMGNSVVKEEVEEFQYAKSAKVSLCAYSEFSRTIETLICKKALIYAVFRGILYTEHPFVFISMKGCIHA